MPAIVSRQPAGAGVPIGRLSACFLTLALAACGGSGGGDGAGAPDVAPTTLGAALPDSAAVAFAASAVSLDEGQRSVAIDVVRTGAATGVTRVAYRLREGSATLGHDVEPLEGTLAWADGEGGPRRLHLVVRSDLEPELDETLELVLESLEGDAPSVDALPIVLRDAPCEATLPVEIASDTTLDAPCYRMETDLTVRAGARLALAPGTTVLAGAGTRLEVGDGATLVADGSAERPVRFAGMNGVSGYWQGLRILSVNPLQQFTATRIEDAVIGLDLLAGTALARFDAGGFARHAVAAVRLPLASAEALDPLTGFAIDAGAVELVQTVVEADDTATLPALETGYRLPADLLIAGTLSLEAGVRVRAARDRRVWVAMTGAVRAIGTADAPIAFEGEIDPIDGRRVGWRGVEFRDAAAGSRLEHVTIRHAGAAATRDGNLSISGAATRLDARHVTLADGFGVGLWLDGDLPDVRLDALHFEGNALAEVRRGTRIGDFGSL